MPLLITVPIDLIWDATLEFGAATQSTTLANQKVCSQWLIGQALNWFSNVNDDVNGFRHVL